MRLTETAVLTLGERDLQKQIVHTAKMLGWMVYHTYDSRKSEPGFPDLVMVRGDRMICAELKTEKDRTQAARLEAQKRWLDALEQAGATTYIWRPSDWYAGDVEKALA